MMALPEHRYYTLKQAANKAGCGIDDLIHFAANGMLQICFKTLGMGFFNSNNNSIHFETDGKLEIDWDEKQSDEVACYYDSDLTLIVEVFAKRTMLPTPTRIEGLLAIDAREFYRNEIELLENELMSTSVGIGIHPPRAVEYSCYDGYEINNIYLHDGIPIFLKDMLITNEEFNLFVNGGQNIGYKYSAFDKYDCDTSGEVTAKRENFSKKKATLIESLVELAFAEDGGTSNLSIDAIADQIQAKFRVSGIPHEDISPYNLRNWLARSRCLKN